MAREKRRKSLQTKVLRRRIKARLALFLILWTAVFAAAGFFAQQAVVPRIADKVADTVSPTTYISVNTLQSYLIQNDSGYRDYLEEVFDTTDQSELVALANETVQVEVVEGVDETGNTYYTAEVDPTQSGWIVDVMWGYVSPDHIWNISTSWINYEPDGTASTPEVYVGIRDLARYYVVRTLKLPFAIAVYALGCLIIVLRLLRRSLSYFDQLSSAVAQLVESEDAVVDLPDSLAITRAELAEVKGRQLASMRAASAAETRKDELVAYLAHDIRTPLTSVLGYLELLADSKDMTPEARERFARVALDKAEHLDGLIDEFFEITRYNLHAIPIERERIGVALFCWQVAEQFFPTAHHAGVQIEVSAPSDEEFFVDPEKLARALGNVVRNALAFAEEGSVVSIKASVASESVMLQVVDRGREISPEHLQAIFEKFFRADEARSSRKGGTGLGLAIAKEIVTAHGGTIEAQSANGLTTFTILVPRWIDSHTTAQLNAAEAASTAPLFFEEDAKPQRQAPQKRKGRHSAGRHAALPDGHADVSSSGQTEELPWQR